METMERVEPAEAPLDRQILTLRKRDRWLAWLAGILAVAVLAMGAWMIFGGDGGESLTAEQEQMLVTIDDYLAAWNAGDGAAAEALMRPSSYHDNGGSRYEADGALETFIGQVHSMGFSVSRTDARIVGTYVFSTERIPADAAYDRPSLYHMSADGKTILSHLAL